MEIDKRYVVIFSVVVVVCLAVYDYFSLFGFGFGFAFAWFLYPYFFKWLHERKVRALARKRAEVARLEREVSGG